MHWEQFHRVHKYFIATVKWLNISKIFTCFQIFIKIYVSFQCEAIETSKAPKTFLQNKILKHAKPED